MYKKIILVFIIIFIIFSTLFNTIILATTFPSVMKSKILVAQSIMCHIKLMNILLDCPLTILKIIILFLKVMSRTIVLLI